jgi:hypothetical protein
VYFYTAGFQKGVVNMSERESRPKRKHRPSFIWPIILIAVGVVFLLGNLGIIEEGIWNQFWRFWPLIFIAIGLDSLFRRNEIAGPVFMIGLGIVILLTSLGLYGWGAWDILWRLWPIMLVTVGLEIIVGRRKLWMSILAVFVIVTGLGSVLWFFGGGPVQGEELVGRSVNQLLGNIEQAEISISSAVGELTINSLTETSSLVSGEVRKGSNPQVYTDFEVSGTTGSFEMDTRNWTNFPHAKPWNWDLGLTKQIPLKVEFSMGVGDMNIDLSELTLSSLDASQAVGELTVSLAGQKNYSADISQAVGSIVVEIPEGVGVRIEVSRAITSLSIPSSFEKRGDYYYSSGYDEAEYKIDLEINQAVGSILVK